MSHMKSRPIGRVHSKNGLTGLGDKLHLSTIQKNVVGRKVFE